MAGDSHEVRLCDEVRVWLKSAQALLPLVSNAKGLDLFCRWALSGAANYLCQNSLTSIVRLSQMAPEFSSDDLLYWPLHVGAQDLCQ
jgi:hypothetical protein